MSGWGPRRLRGLDYIWWALVLFMMTIATTDELPDTVLLVLFAVFVAGTLLIYWVQFKR